MIKTKSYKVVQNFFEDPDRVRKSALNQNYQTCNFHSERGIWSGYRTDIKDKNIIDEITSKLETITNNTFQHLNLVYCINTAASCLGYPHKDAEGLQDSKFNLDIAGVIYLNKDAPEDTGTTLYEDSDTDISSLVKSYRSKMEIVYCQQIPPKNFLKQNFAMEINKVKKESLTQIVKFENEYNKLVVYSADYLHSPDHYFGTNKENSRLTIAFHGKFKRDAN